MTDEQEKLDDFSIPYILQNVELKWNEFHTLVIDKHLTSLLNLWQRRGGQSQRM
jgi:hypothetical protein